MVERIEKDSQGSLIQMDIVLLGGPAGFRNLHPLIDIGSVKGQYESRCVTRSERQLGEPYSSSTIK